MGAFSDLFPPEERDMDVCRLLAFVSTSHSSIRRICDPASKKSFQIPVADLLPSIARANHNLSRMPRASDYNSLDTNDREIEDMHQQVYCMELEARQLRRELERSGD